MFVREKRIGAYRYLYLVETVREGGKTKQHIIRNLGRKEAVEASGDLDRLARSAARLSQRSMILSLIEDGGAPDVRCRRIGAPLLFEGLWQEVAGGLIAHPFDRARDLLKFFRDATASLPDEHTVFGGLIHAPDGSGTKLAAIVMCHCGSLADGEKAMQPLKQFGPPAMDALGPIPYCQLNGMLDAGFPKGALNYWKSSFLKQLSDKAIDTMVECFARCPTPMGALLLEHFHGAATRVAPTETAFPHRSNGYNFLVLSQWMEPATSGRCTAWAQDTYAQMEPFVAPGRYANYLGDDETGDPTAAAYGPNYRRLQELKTKYDPGNFFHINQNIRPLS